MIGSKSDLQVITSRLEHQLTMLQGRMEERQKTLEGMVQKTDHIENKEFVIKEILCRVLSALTNSNIKIRNAFIFVG